MTVIVRLRERFHQRASEWFCAANMAVWGAILLHPSETFSSPAYEAFRRIGERGTGFLVGGLGLAWLLGLIINGARQRVTSSIRLTCALVGALVYSMLGVGFVCSYFVNGVLSTGTGTYFLISALAFYSLYWITIDKRING